MMATPAARAAGSTCSSGLRRKQLRMICTLATAGLAMAVGGVEEGDAGLHRGLERRLRLLRRHRSPVGAELPGAKAHDADLAAEPLHPAGLHSAMLARRRGKRGDAHGLSPVLARACS